MAFLFKNKKNQDRAVLSREGLPGTGNSINNAAARITRDEKQRSTPTGSVNSLDIDGSIGSPEKPYAAARQRGQSVDPPSQPTSAPQSAQHPGQQSDLPFRNANGTPQPNAPVSNAVAPAQNATSSLYPWSQRKLTYTSSHPSPFPRYGAAVNSVSSKEGDIYVMGGLINSSTVKGDLWMIEAGGNMACYPLATTAEGPGPRVGHASLLVGNAFIVYGGDTKIEESDVLDETLYLLNTSTRQWSRALPAGPRPSGRYGHSLNILGSKIYIFGGQIEGYFMNDLAAYDLNQLQMPNNRWEMLQANNDGTGAMQGKVPPARTNHSMVTFNDKMYLFGGTNGFQWFNDVWCYDAASNSWSQLDCIGYIPVPREGHAAALVDDVMYVFGGRTEEGADLGDLAAFRITSKRWYTFQNMGPSPSPRSGHSMTAVGKTIVTVGGEPSSAATTVNDLAIVYVLDTTKIRYPNDAQVSAQRNATRRPSDAQATKIQPASEAIASRGTEARDGADSRASNGVNGSSGKPPGRPVGQPRTGPPVSQVTQSHPGRTRNLSSERNEVAEDSVALKQTQSPVPRQSPEHDTAVNGNRTPTQQKRVVEMSAVDTKSKGSPTESGLRQATMANRPVSPPPPTRNNSNPLSRRSSGRNSQTVALLKELDSARNRIAWYASELELAKKSGYTSNASMSPILDSRAAETFDDEDKPLIEALIAMRTELANVQASVDKQAVLAAKQIAEAERQRDAAIQEAIYAKARMAARSGSMGTPQLDSDKDDDRVSEMSRKLATALKSQKELQNQVDRLVSEVETEQNARKLADDTSQAGQKRMADLETYKQQNSLAVEQLKAELHLAQREAREQSVVAAESTAAQQMLKVERDEFENKYKEAVASGQEHSTTLTSLRAAVAASAETKKLLEVKLEEERTSREMIETKLNNLKAEHEAQTSELESISQRLRDAEEIAEKHANEARTHREAIVAGLDKIAARDAPEVNRSDADRIIALQGQLNASNALVRKHQQEADNASDKLRSAEERIAGLEAYQEQASREGVSIRRQLQSALRETQTLQAANSDLKHQLENQRLETNAMIVQHNTLKDILSERGLSPTSGPRVRSLNSPREGSPELMRLRELEQQLNAVSAQRDEAKASAASQAQEADAQYREKLAQLENDYQSAVHYVKGTEKMLKQLKEQLSRYKTDNARLKDQVMELEDQIKGAGPNGSGKEASTAWEVQRQGLQAKIDNLQAEMRTAAADLELQLEGLRRQLSTAEKDRESAREDVQKANQHLDMTKKDLEQLQQENALLEQRAADAEHKVGTLLDQFELSVDNYRRRSRQVSAEEASAATGGANGANAAHARHESSEAGSVYGGTMSEARNSAALDSLANELDMLRSHWEATNKNYRLSNAFEFDTVSTGATTAKKDEGTGLGLSESLADWRKRLDDTHPDSRPGGAK